jgi:hypothetical protein
MTARPTTSPGDIYQRPDRAEIAARVLAEQAATASEATSPAPVERCRACGYLEMAPGHRIICAPVDGQAAR